MQLIFTKNPEGANFETHLTRHTLDSGIGVGGGGGGGKREGGGGVRLMDITSEICYKLSMRGVDRV